MLTARNSVKREIKVEIPEVFLPLVLKPKRIKLVVSGRGAAKSISFAKLFLKFCDDGERLCCAREYQNSIDDSVHALLREQIVELQGDDPRYRTLRAYAKSIESDKDGYIFYRGLARNIDSLRSLQGVKRLWVEEAQACSTETIEVGFPTIRESGSEIWLSMNRGSSKDPISIHLLKPHENDLLKNNGYYEDDEIMIIDTHYSKNPWFPKELEQQRRRDKRVLSPAKYAHIWDGAYSDTIENAIITPDMFDACVDAHIKLGIEPRGIEVVTLDPADTSLDDNAVNDSKALSYRHGIVIKDVQYWTEGDVNDAGDRGINAAIAVKADEFIWDGDGMGLGLRRQFDSAVLGKKITLNMFRGGETPDNPNKIYEPMDSEIGNKGRTIGDYFENKRAQYYWDVRDRMVRTMQAINKKAYHDPDTLISISSKIKDIAILRAEMCRIPKKDRIGGIGKFQVMSKVEMKKRKIDSPNGSDTVMMSFSAGSGKRRTIPYQVREHTMSDPTAGY